MNIFLVKYKLSRKVFKYYIDVLKEETKKNNFHEKKSFSFSKNRY